MAKIRVEIDVPDGDKCSVEGDCQCSQLDYWNEWCERFTNHVYGFTKLPQCIAATVKEEE